MNAPPLQREPAPAGQGDSRRLAVDLLCQWESGRAYADQLLHEGLAQARLPDPRDRALVTDLFYGILRNLRLLDYLLEPMIRRPLDVQVRNALRLGLYQLLFTRIPEHAAVDGAVNCAGPGRKLVNAILRGLIREWPAVERAHESASLEVRESHPDFLVRRWRRFLSEEEIHALLIWNNLPAENWVRLNSLKASAFDDLAAPDRERLEPTENPLFYKVRGGLPWEALDSGKVYAQDPSTVISCDLLAPRPGEHVLDACAAPGGKCSYLAAQMRGQGRLVACDADAGRLNLLRENLARLGADFAETKQMDWTLPPSGEVPAIGFGAFDAVLADVPCSNTGVLRRRVDARWRLTPGEFGQMAATQLGILRMLAGSVRPGGRLVYSTCSIDPEENRELVEKFVRTPEGAAFRLAEERVTLPWRDGVDGAYAALLVKALEGGCPSRLSEKVG